MPLKRKSGTEITYLEKKETNFPYLNKNWKRNEEDMAFSNFNFFSDFFFLTSPYEYSNERVDDVIPSQFSTHLFKEMTKNSYFYQPKINGKLCLCSHISIQGYAFTLFCKKKNSCIIYDKLWGHDITNWLIWIFIRTG